MAPRIGRPTVWPHEPNSWLGLLFFLATFVEWGLLVHLLWYRPLRARAGERVLVEARHATGTCGVGCRRRPRPPSSWPSRGECLRMRQSHRGGHEIGGILGDPAAGTASWGTLFEVQDTDATVARTIAAGGTSTTPSDLVYGRTAESATRSAHGSASAPDRRTARTERSEDLPDGLPRSIRTCRRPLGSKHYGGRPAGHVVNVRSRR